MTVPRRHDVPASCDTPARWRFGRFRRLWSCALLLLVAIPVHAQPPPQVLAPLPDLAPAPIYDPSLHALDAFSQAWQRVLVRKKGHVTVLFWGASHTAADIWTGELRRRWSLELGEGGHGFVFPFKWAPGSRAQDLVVEASKGWQVTRAHPDDEHKVQALGLMGLVAASADPADFATVRTTNENTLGREFNRLEIWLQSNPDGGTVHAEIDGKPQELPTRGEAGSAIVHTFALAMGPHEVKLAPAGNGPVAIYGMVVERSTPGVVVDQLGIPGMRAEVLLHWREDVFRGLVARRKPDLVVLAYGTNDVGDESEPIETYLANWRKVLLQVRTAAPDASCLIVGPTDRLAKDDKRTMPRTPAVIAAQRKVAAEFRCAHWDAQAAMGGAGAMTTWTQAGLTAKDDVHLNRAGYEKIAALMDAELTKVREGAKPAGNAKVRKHR